MKAKRTYKDSLFRDIFRDKDRLAELYYALTGETAHSVDIKITTLKDTVFSSVKNDLSFRVGDRHIILIEHQSTLNENMPLRMLLYLAQMYQKDVPSDLIYREARVPLPAPQFYVFYNGEKYEVPVKVQRLSEAFGGEHADMELCVTVYNIDDDAAHEILTASRALKSYSVFIAHVRKLRREGVTLENAVMESIAYCINNDFLANYFTETQKEEVFQMVSFKWDEEVARRVWQEEAEERGMKIGMEKGIQQGMQQGMQQGLEKGIVRGAENMLTASLRNLMETLHFPLDKAMDALQVPQNEREKYAALVKG